MQDRHDDAHTTCGEHFRVPAHPEMVAALGRAMWNFFSLEEGIVALLSEANASDLSASRSLNPTGKEKRLRQLQDDLARRSAPADLLASIGATVTAFRRLRKKHRNALAHAHAFTAGYDDDGTYLPGLAHTAIDGSQILLAAEARDLLEIAHDIEDGGLSISHARRQMADFKTASGARSRR